MTTNTSEETEETTNTTDDDLTPESLRKTISIPIAAVSVGLMVALTLSTTINGFSYLNQTLDQLSVSEGSSNLASVASINPSNPTENSEPQETNRVIVKFKEGKKIPPGLKIAAEKANLEKAQGLTHLLTINGIDAQVYEVSEDDTASEVVDRILASKKHLVEYAEIDMMFSSNATYTPNDSRYPDSTHWFISKTEANTAWDTTKGEGVTVAILDSGVNCEHPDLTGNCVSGWNTYNNSSNTNDLHGHGTAVTGAAASVGDNAQGGVGVAYNSRIMPVKVSDDSGNTTCSALASGITYAADNNAKVASNSYKIIGCTSVNVAADYMASKGGLYVRAIGNDSYEVNESNPANVIHVSATDQNDSKTSWSNYGAPVDVAAPGINVYCTTVNGGYGYCWGTSLSVPIVSGVLALMYSANPELTPEEAKSILFTTADDLGEPGWDMYYGHGRVNAANAVAAALASGGGGSTPDTTPPTTPTNLTIAGVTDTSVNLTWSQSTDNVLVSTYNLYRDGQKINSTAGLEFTDTSVSPSTTYNYSLSAVDSSGNESTQSTAVTVSTLAPEPVLDTTPPTTPANLTAVGDATDNSVTLNWSQSTDNVLVSSYNVYRDGQKISSTPDTIYTDPNLSLSTSYTYTVSAVDSSGNESAQSTSASATITPDPTPDTTPPTTPTNLTTGGITDNSVSISWAQSTDNVLVSAYNVYRNNQKVATISNTTYTDPSLAPSTTYTYKVSAVDSSNNESAQSASVSATTQDVPLAITSYSVPTKTNTSATIAVVLNNPATVTVNYGTSANSLNLSAQSATLNTTHSLDLTNLNSKTIYYYQVVATDQTGKVVTSPTSNFKTPKGGGGGGTKGGGKGKNR